MLNINKLFMSKEKLSKIFSIIVGIVFLISGFGKILNVTDFAFLINSYGLGWAIHLAPIIVIVEITIGILLIFGIQLRWVSVFAILMLIVFTIAYGYGYWIHGIENCGCFGVIGRTKTPFWLVLLRNIFLIYFMFEIYRRTTIEPILIKWKPTVIIFAIVVASFISGLTYSPPVQILSSETKHNMIGKSISDFSAPLNELLSSDSSYVVFVFSYGCPHCWNSVENLKQYANLPEIDRVIGITSSDTTRSALFQMQFNPQFSIYAMPPTIMETLVKGFPTTFYIKNGYVKQVIEGELPCSYFFKESLTINYNTKK